MNFSIKDKSFGTKKIDAVSFGLAAGITIGILFILATFFALFNVPGFTELCNLIGLFYGPLGYSISPLGVLIGGVYSFGDGFIITFITAWIYNKLVR